MQSHQRRCLAFFHGPRGLISSVLYSPIADSINALSSASPTVPMEASIPASTRCVVNRKDVYCDPASE